MTMDSRYVDLQSELELAVPAERVVTDPFHTAAWGADASCYRMQPAVVVTVESEDEVTAVLASCREQKTPVTFRAAGTSLSGQGVTDSVLVRLGDGWDGIQVSPDTTKITLGPGVRGAKANVALKPYGKKIGPDPASIAVATIGGIAANNASGMCCGTSQNSYNTLDSMRVILADGTLLDTGDLESVTSFAKSHSYLLSGLARLREETLANKALTERIKKKFQIKNVTGYSINAIVDYEDPVEILQHLMIGSEGTLGFIAEITYQTVEDPAYKAATLAFYENPRMAADAVIALSKTPVVTCELIDRAGIRSAEGKPNMPDFLSELGPQATALLIEVQGSTKAQLEANMASATEVIESYPKLRPVTFSTDPAVCAGYWAVRKGLLPAVGALRETGSTVIIEDVAFPIEHLARAVSDLQDLFQKYAYDDAVMFGHALEGNLHVVFSLHFRGPEDIRKYAQFMDEFCDLVANRYDGSLKAEHGIGRNVAPYVELEWGPDAFRLMHQIKALFDPERLLNPGVILNDDPEVHLKNLKSLPAAHPITDKCIECGFCEGMCPSAGLTTSPRQRTVAQRFLNDASNSKEEIAAVQSAFNYQVLDTCSACGLCAMVCPVGIDTGAFVKYLRAQSHTTTEEGLAGWVANHFGTVKDAAWLGLRAGALAKSLFGASATEAMSGVAHAVTAGMVPKWSPAVPDGYRHRPPTNGTHAHGNAASTNNHAAAQATYVYMPSCVSRTMQPVAEKGYHEPLPMVVGRLAEKAGIKILYPEGLREMCCGQPFESKGLKDQADNKATEVFEGVRKIAGDGPIKVLSDTSPCSYRLGKLQPENVEVVDLVQFLHEEVLPKLNLSPSRKKIAVHATCSIKKMGLTGQLVELAKACAPEVVTPANVECCGFAGDRGFTYPELNAHALRRLREEVDGAEAGCSSSVTCEIGLCKHSGIEYRSIAYFVDEASATS